MDEAGGVSDVDMTENRDIPDHPWPYVREIISVKKDFWQIHCVSVVYLCINVLI